MDPSEVEFLAEKETITVIPNFKGEKLFLLSVSITIIFSSTENTLLKIRKKLCFFHKTLLLFVFK